jgi:hypothetical protein
VSVRTKVRTHVDTELMKRFRTRFPIEGATSWLLETSMRMLMESEDLDDAEGAIMQSMKDLLFKHKQEAAQRVRVANANSLAAQSAATKR